MTIEPPVARYQQVASQLRDAIRRGDYAPGSELPSQPELARQYGLNQTTISKAIGVLRVEGLVRTEQGRRTIVEETLTAKRVRRIPRAGSQGGGIFASEMQRLGLEPSTTLAKVAVTAVPEEIADYLQLNENDQVLLRRRHMFASGTPVQIATSYIPMTVAGDVSIAEPDTGPTGMYQRLAARGFRPARFTEEIEIRRARAEEVAFLQLAEGQPVFSIVRTTWGQNDRPIEATINVLAGSRWRLIYEWTYEPDA
ncbi:GntR family transcriptional regulator [Frankia sp. Cas4]|uniref:GntR family transcriptional regulator n=1 Tax=Frankia sp. Cas4 TaxID=3073927 RepID=UPI002AD4B4C4|nr:GntR family transcriptional regulator [Frankia sp. Cas4]